MSIESWRTKIFGYYYHLGLMIYSIFKIKIFHQPGYGFTLRLLLVLLMSTPMIIRIILVGLVITAAESCSRNWAMAYMQTLMSSLGIGAVIILYRCYNNDYFNNFSQKMSKLYEADYPSEKKSFAFYKEYMIFVFVFAIAIAFYLTENFYALESQPITNDTLFRKPMFGPSPTLYFIDIAFVAYSSIMTILCFALYSFTYRALFDYMLEFNENFETAIKEPKNRDKFLLDHHFNKNAEFLEVFRYANCFWAPYASKGYLIGIVVFIMSGFLYRAYMPELPVFTLITMVSLIILGIAMLHMTMFRPMTVYRELQRTKNFLLLNENARKLQEYREEISDTLSRLTLADYPLLLFQNIQVTERLMGLTYIGAIIAIEILNYHKKPFGA